jgi:hypothetical protein
MPEYLAPAVYVEEIDTGNKPIEGVSTSTAGMVGVTERGPVNVPILITSYGEYVRWFGARLNRAEFDDHCYLPHAVEGFFTNGGKRVYLVRVLDTSKAQMASTFLFDRGTAVSVATRLLHASPSGGSDVIVVNGSGLTLNQWLQIDAGANVEYRQISAAPTSANEIALRLPLAFAHANGVNVEHYAALGAPTASPQLMADINPADTHITLDAASGIGGGSLLRLGTASSGDEEFVFADSVTAAAPFVVTLRTAAMLSHKARGGEVVDVLPPLGSPPDTTTLDAASNAGDAVIIVADHNNFTTAGELIRIADGNQSEFRHIGQLGMIALGVGAYTDYVGGTIVEKVTIADAGGTTDKHLTADAAAGSPVLRLDNREGLLSGKVVRIGQPVDADVEYATIQAIPTGLPAPNPGLVILTNPLQRAHPATIVAREQTVTPVAPLVAASLAIGTNRKADQLVLSNTTGFGANEFVRLQSGANTYFHRLASGATPATPQKVTLSTSLDLPHSAGRAVAAREPLMLVRALDAGAWGNRLRVSVQEQNPPLVNTRIRVVNGIIDSTHIRLDSANGIEIGTVLQRVDASGNLLDTPFKVSNIDRQNGFLLTLDAAAPLPGGAALGDRVRSFEFQLDVFLLRQEDPALPTRNETVLDSESFRNLSLDPDHSRYIHKVIGTTWDGILNDDDGHPLRRADRRSEGESVYVRVRDQTPAKTIRLGPEPLLDVLPDGRTRPTRLPLDGGDDMVGFVLDDTYVGQDDPNPENRTGLHSLRNMEEISIVACPGRTSSIIQNALINHCELMRYRFAVLDGPRPPQDTLADVQTQRQQYDTKYAALYHPWLLIPDPYPTNLSQIADYPIPPSGHMLGIYARTDIERGVHKAPANEVVRGIIGLQRILNKEQHDILNPYPVNINVIRDFRDNNRGIRVYGGRVISSDSDWKYVNVRRLLIFIEASIDRGLQWVVFEPNAEPLWARVRRSISNFLTLVWRNGGLEGAKVEEAYFVKCDRTTMTQTDIDSGRLICVVGVAPVKPAEFVIVRIGLWTAHAED